MPDRIGHADSTNIRPAIPADWARIAELLAEVGLPSIESQADFERHQGGFVAYLARRDVEALVGEENGSVIAYIGLEYRERLMQSGPEAWIPNLVVAASHRRRGIGRRLLIEAESRAQRRGCLQMSLQSGLWRADAHTFYAVEGWTESGKSFSKSL